MTASAAAENTIATIQQAKARAPSRTYDISAMHDYWPLRVFSPKAKDPGPRPRNKAEQYCEVLIKLKEMELSKMISENF